MKTDAIVICGPTATGKTHAGVIVAHENNGEIISADSRQVYRELNIGSGKDIDEYGLSDGAVAYHCIDIADPADTYTLYRYMNDFSESYKGITQKGKLPVIVGGSGLYVEGALKGYSVPEAPENPALRESLMMKETAELLDLLKKYPEIEAQTDHTSKKRIVRAIEIGIAGGRSDIKKEMSKPENPFVIGISFPREELHARIYSRLHERLDHGMIEEVESLTKKNRVLALDDVRNGIPAYRPVCFG